MSFKLLARLVPAFGLVALAPACAQNVFTEDFSASPSALTLNPGSGQTTFTDTGGNLAVFMTGGFEASSAYTNQTWANADLTGQQWGIRQIKAGNTLNITYDNLSISVIPEPSSAAALLGAFGLACAGLRPRRR